MTRNTPEVSVIIPAYQAKNFIYGAIDSALGQSDVAVEVIIIDDCSPDGTASAVISAYHRDSRVRVITLSANGGPAVARNRGILESKADYIAVLDADDVYEDGRLRRLVDLAKSLNADVIADNIRFYDAKTGNLSVPQLAGVFNIIKIDTNIFVDQARPGTAGMDLGLLKPMFRRKFLEISNVKYPSNVRHGEDFLFYFHLLRAGANFYIDPKVGYRWTLRTSGQSQTKEDYIGQRSQALILAKSVRDDTKLISLLRIRARELLRLHFTKKTDAAKAANKPLRMLLLGLQYPQFSIPRYAKAVLRKIR